MAATQWPHCERSLADRIVIETTAKHVYNDISLNLVYNEFSENKL